ncbi:ecdysteroid 22-kinase family protein [Nocardia sp. NBC_00565]|uniref:phosphotransferase n=1 Tax=Nocardia sp. NBC_00565 TaxID=2975993 RepID=UPI002E80F7FE|nr:phosphotransferase [Nocardia sp. NBC_00565]WUC05686.1 ecdysteroid 22-kinase family protein [Nocardia sp. NBC_00565]
MNNTFGRPHRWHQTTTLARALGQVALALSPWAPGPKPHAAKDVTPKWITSVFADRAPGAIAEDVRDVGGTTGTTDRRRVRVGWNTAGRDAGLPDSLFVKSTPLSGKNRTMVAALDMAVNEVKFYLTARPTLPDGVAPTAFAAHAGHGARHLLLLQDLVADGHTTYAMADDCTLEHAEGLMVALGSLHATFWESPRFATDLAYAVTQSRRPGFGLMLGQFRKMRKTLMRSGEYELPGAVHRMAEFVNEHDWQLHARWEDGPLTLIHGDSHLGNTFRLADGRAGLLDWQVVGRAPGMREVSYFLTHSLGTELRRQHEKDLLRRYLETLNEQGVPDAPTFDQAWDDYRYFAFDAWDSAAICTVWPGLQNPANVDAAFRRANATIEDLEVDKALRAALG